MVTGTRVSGIGEGRAFSIWAVVVGWLVPIIEAMHTYIVLLEESMDIC